MLDFTHEREQQLEVWLDLMARQTALVALLAERGVFTIEELEAMQVQTRAGLDEMVAKRKAEAEAEFDSAHPGVRELWNTFFGDKAAAKPEGPAS
jgi:hypothetical protein